MATDPALAAYGSLPFAEQIAFFKAKVALPSARWTDLWQAAHDRAFVVAGATKMDLLADLRAAVLQGVAAGGTLAEFRRDFEALVDKHGWTGWTGEGSEAGRAWRTRVIYATNLRTSYAAGRYAQAQALADRRPYWRYHHNDTVTHPRPLHKSWDGLVLRHDDPWWRSHWPPNGWGCRCRIETLADRDLKRLGKDGPDRAPDDGTYDWVDQRTKRVYRDIPQGIDPGWDYAPGATWHPDLDKYPYELARELVAANLRDGVFDRWHQRIAGQVAAELTKPAYAGLDKAATITSLRTTLARGEVCPVAVLPPPLVGKLEVATQVVGLSDWDLVKQQVSRAGKDFDALAYLNAQVTLEHPGLVVRENEQMTLFVADAAGHWYAGVVQQTATRRGLFLKSFRRSSLRDAKLQRKKGQVLVDALPE